MKIHLVVALAGLAIGFAVPTLGQQKEAASEQAHQLVTVDPNIAQQIRFLAVKYDEAMNKHDAAAIAALYTDDGVRASDWGTFRGRQSIEKSYGEYDFHRWPVSNFFTTVNRVTMVRNEARSIGKWSGVFMNHSGGHDNDGGFYSWVLVREGDNWKIRRNTSHGAGNPFGTNFSCLPLMRRCTSFTAGLQALALACRRECEPGVLLVDV